MAQATSAGQCQQDDLQGLRSGVFVAAIQSYGDLGELGRLVSSRGRADGRCFDTGHLDAEWRGGCVVKPGHWDMADGTITVGTTMNQRRTPQTGGKRWVR
ncbi:MAG: hypothetical protein IPO91_34610 [Chloroflexi bacterium]|nr:hypothetical protein [Chloroflexota bacterium]